MTLRPHLGGKSDLYTWREIFRLYAEAQVFESVSESTQGERSVEDVEKQLVLFKQLVQDKKASLILPASRDALDVFLSLNVFILDVKRVQLACLLYGRADSRIEIYIVATCKLGSDSQDPQEAHETYDTPDSLLFAGTRSVCVRALSAPMCIDHSSLEIATKASRASHRRGSFTHRTPH